MMPLGNVINNVKGLFNKFTTTLEKNEEKTIPKPNL